MTPVLKTVGILAASCIAVTSSLLLSQGPTSRVIAEPAPLVASDSNQFLTAIVESTHALRGTSDTHVAISVLAPDVLGGERIRPDLSVAIVIDRSGSMSGQKLEQAKRAATELVRKLEARDSFSVTVYGTEVKTIITRRKAAPEAVREATERIGAIRDQGGTNLSGGLVGGRDELRHDSGGIRRIVLISDGKATNGITSAQGLSQLARETAERGISVTTVGIGLDFDEKKMTNIAVAGRGNYYFAENASDLSSMFATELGRVTATAATDVAVTFEPGPGVEIAEAYGYKLQGNTANLADLHIGETRRVVLRLRAKVGTNGPARLGGVKLSLTKVDGTRVEETAALGIEVTDDHHAVIRGQSPDAVSMVERARTAVTLDKATALYEQGDGAGARRIIRERRAAGLKRAAEIGSDDLDAELSGFADEAEASFAPAPASAEGKSSRKRNRAKSYDLLH